MVGSIPTPSAIVMDVMREEITKYLLEYFKQDKQKVHAWLMTKNPLLGNVAPIEMIMLGREKKLLEFIKDAIEQ